MTNRYHNNPENESFLFGKDKALPFLVPDGYFESFETLLRMKMEVLDEIGEFSALSAIDKQHSFITPENYFPESKNQLEVKCELSDFSVLSSIPKRKMEEKVSLNPEKILGGMDELREFGTLSSVKKENRFEVAPDYFESSAPVIRETVLSAARPKGKLVQMIFRPKMVMAYAAAIVIAICAVFYFNNSKHGMETVDCKTLACLEKNEILNEKNLNEFSEEDLYDMVDEAQLDELSIDSLSVTE